MSHQINRPPVKWSWLVMMPLALCLCWALPVLTVGAAAEHDEKPQLAGPPVQEEKPADASAKSQASKREVLKPEQASRQPAANQQIGWLAIDKPLREGPSPYAWVSEQDAGQSLKMVVEAINRVAQDPAMNGLVLSLEEPSLTLSQIDQIAQAVQRVRAAGKKVLAFAESYDMSSYMLAAACDQILLQHKGRVELHGLGVEEMYLAGTLEKIGVKADFIQVGQYKGADEALTRKGPSEPWNKNFDALLDDMYAQVVQRITKGRNLTQAELETLFTDVWWLSDEDLVKRKVVDHLCERDLVTVTQATWGDEFAWVDLDTPANAAAPQNPLALMSMLFQEKSPRIRQPSIAVIWAQGEITSGESASHAPVGSQGGASPAAGLLSSTNIGSKTIIKAVEDARDNDMIQGVVVFVDSPGGSAVASELMWQAVRDLAQYKPVYVVVGSMAASGGYYIACAADKIYVSSSSIVGSIGVVGGKIVMGGLYDKLGVNVYRRSRGPMGDLFNSVEPFTKEQRRALEKAFESTYEQFLDRVNTGRGDRLNNVKAVAEGKLFTGQQAVDNGMADELGGVEEAIHAMATELNLQPGQFGVIDLPGPMNFGEFLERTFGGVHGRAMNLQVNIDALSSLKMVMGPKAWRAAGPVLSGLMLLQHEPILTLMPAAIVVR